MGNFNRLGLLTLVFCAVFIGALTSSSPSSSDPSQQLYKASLGRVTLYDENRATWVDYVVPLDHSLFGKQTDQYTQDAVNGLKELVLLSNSLCKELDLDAGNHSSLMWSAAPSDHPLSSEEVQNLKHKYSLALAELSGAKNIELEAIKNPILQKALRPVVARLPHPTGVTISVNGCSDKSELIVSLSSGAAIERDSRVKMLEVADYGRFVAEKRAFVRVDIAGHWARSENNGVWSRVDFARCEKSDKATDASAVRGWLCPHSALTPTTECTPADLEGCPVTVQFTSDNFVTNFSMPNGSVVVASNFPDFVTHDGKKIEMPASGVLLVDLAENSRLTFGQLKIKAVEGKASKAFKLTSINNPDVIYFADVHVMDADFDASAWAFRLQTTPGATVIVGRRTGALYVAAAFLGENAWWCMVVTLAVVLSVALTLLTLMCRGRIANTYQKYSPRLQRKRVGSEASASSSEEDPELGAADAEAPVSEEEFQAERKNKLTFASLKLNFFGDKAAALTDRAPAAAEQVATEGQSSIDSWRSRYYKNLRQLVSLQSLKPTKTIAEEEETISNTATDGSDEEKSAVELTSVKVDEKASTVPATTENSVVKAQQNTVISILDVAKFLNDISIADNDLVDARHHMLRTRRKPHGDKNEDRMWMNLVDFYALIKYGPNITAEEYAQIKTQEGLTREDCSRVGYALKGLHLRNTMNAGRTYRFHHLVRKFPKSYIIEDSQMGKTTMADLYEFNYGVNLKYPGLPVVAIYPPGGHREFVPMECLQVFEDKEIVFSSIRLARLAASVEKIVKQTEARVKAELQPPHQQQQAAAKTAKAQPAQ